MTQGYYDDYIRQLLEQEQQRNSPYENVKKLTGDIYKTGKKMTAAGDFIGKHVNNPAVQNVAANMSKVGNSLSTGAGRVNNVLSPQNYFKGFAPKPFDVLKNKIGTSLANGLSSPAVTNAAGNAIGSEIAGNVAGNTLGSSALTSAISEAAPMATASGLGAGTAAGTAAGSAAAGGATGAAAGAGTGAAAGGAAAGGSAAGAGAAAGPIGALVALGVMALQGANRKKAKQSGQALLSGLNKEGEAALEQTNQFAKNMQNQAQDYSQPMLPTSYNGITGGAAPIEQLSPVQEYQNYLREQGYDDNVVNGVTQGLNYGNKEIDDWIKQYNSGAGRDNPINIPQTEEEIAAAKAGNFNVPMQAGNAEETIKKGLLDKFISGISDLTKGYEENRNNAFKPENLQRDDSKSKMNRIGEAFGTIGRMAQKPLVQGLVAGGLSTALTGNPLYGLGQGYKFANNRAMSNAYKDVLKQYGFDVPDAGFFGNFDSNDVRTVMYPQVEQMKNDRELARLQALNDYRTGQLENQKIKNAISQQNADTNKQKALIQEYKAKNGSKVTHVSTGGGKKTGSVTGTKNPNYNQALSQYYGILQSGDPKKISYARQRFIREIGVDPDTKIKQAAKKQGGASAPSNDEEAFLREIGY